MWGGRKWNGALNVRVLGIAGRGEKERRSVVCVVWWGIRDGSIGVGGVMFGGHHVCITGSVVVVEGDTR